MAAENDTIQTENQRVTKSRLTIGGYGEAVYIQHKLHMENDIRTGWCRTTPLWGRGLSAICTGSSDRLHDCHAS